MSRERKQRGILATPTGKERLQKAKADRRELNKALSYERIAHKADLDKKTVERFLRRLKPVDRDSAYAICQALELEITDIVDPDEWNDDQLLQTSKKPITTPAILKIRLPRVEKWQGRQREIDDLTPILLNEKQQHENISLIGIIAAGGYGKSALAVKLTEQKQLKQLISEKQVSLLWVSFIQPYSLAQFGRWLLEKLEQAYDEKWDEATLIEQMINGLIDKRYFE